MVMEVVHEDIGEDNMQCPNHPYKNSIPGGICAFCLQEKLGKLVSSSFPIAIFPSSTSSSSSSPSFRSDFNGNASSSNPASAAATALQAHHLPSSSTTSQYRERNYNYNGYYTRKTKLPFFRKNKKKEIGVMEMGKSSDSSSSTGSIVFKRSKSTATPRRGMHFLDEYNLHKRGFWSFLHLPKNPITKSNEKDLNFTPTTASSVCNNTVVVEENESPNFERRVSRSRSVGCGSRSFSGDFFERISTGFGDCTLRRVESQREGKPPKVQSIHNGHDSIKERVKCGGIFSGFMITSSSSSSSSSSYWDKPISTVGASIGNVSSHGRSKSWGWAFASPMRIFNKPSGVKRGAVNSSKNVTPNLAGIPSLLSVSG